MVLTGAGASAPLGLPLMSHFIKDDFWKSGDQWFQVVAYLSYQWSRANRGVADFEFIYTLAHVLSEVTLDDPLAYAMTQQAPAIVNLPTASGVNLNVDAVRRGAQVVREFLRRHVHDTLQDFDSERASRIYADLLNPLLERLGDKPMVSVFTTNYDRVIETIWQRGLHVQAFARPTVLRRGFTQRDQYQPGLSWDSQDFDAAGRTGEATVRLFKLHGSLHWRKTATEIVETEANEYADASVVIYPLRGTKVTLDEPFATLFRFWRTTLASSTDCIVIGSSLRDAHLVDGIVETLNQNPRLKVWLLDKNATDARRALPEAVHNRVVPVNATFGERNVGVRLADYIFDPSKREAAQAFSLSDEPIK